MANIDELISANSFNIFVIVTHANISVKFKPKLLVECELTSDLTQTQMTRHIQTCYSRHLWWLAFYPDSHREFHSAILPFSKAPKYCMLWTLKLKSSNMSCTKSSIPTTVQQVSVLLIQPSRDGFPLGLKIPCFLCGL